jgi:hypothetical protein
MDPSEWRQKQERHELIPMTEKNIAPDELLKIIHCICSGECKSAQCSCRRYVLPGTAAYGPCQEVDTAEEEG